MSKFSSRLGFGVLAGIVGGVLMVPLLIQICSSVADAFMVSMNMQPMMMSGPQPILVAMGMTVVPGADMTTAANAAVAMHMATSVIIGVVFALITTVLYKPEGLRKILGAANVGTGLLIGIIYSAVVWVVFFLPLLMFSFLPNLAMLTAMDLKQPASMVTMDMMNSVGGLAMGLTFASHLFYGAVIGLIVGGLTSWKSTLTPTS